MATPLHPPTVDDDPILYFDEACRIARIPESTMRELRRNGRGPAFARSGRRLRIRRSRLREWIDDYDNPDQP